MQQKLIESFQFVTKHSEYKPGMPAMVECFATWCPPCRAAIPHLAEMTAHYPKVYIVSTSNEDAPTVEKLKSKMPKMSEYNLAVDAGGLLGQYQQEQGVNGIPHAFIFDGAGTLVWQGHPMDGECKQTLEKLNK